MRVLVACEESQEVCKAFRAKGHEAYSCDILPCSGGHPESHLAVSGAKHFAKKIADGRQQQGIEFFNLFTKLECQRVAIENPIGIMSRLWRKPDQIIQPYQFGHEVSKSTCLWLKGLPLLKSTNLVGKGEIHICPSGKRIPKWYSANAFCKDGTRQKARSKTFPGIAKAMAEQWG